MKKLLTLAAIAIAVVAMNACKSSDSPEKVAEKFLNHINKKEFAEAKKLVTPESEATIDMWENFSKMGGETSKESKIENLKCKISEETVEGKKIEKATCEYTDNGEPKELNLVKKDGKWLVEMKKETPDLNTTEMESDSTVVTQDTAQKK